MSLQHRHDLGTLELRHLAFKTTIPANGYCTESILQYGVLALDHLSHVFNAIAVPITSTRPHPTTNY